MEQIILKIDDVAVAACTNCTLNVEQTLIEVCSPTDGRAVRYKPKTYGWSSSFEAVCHNVEYADELVDCVADGTEIEVELNDKNGSYMCRTGKAYVKSAVITSKAAGLVRIAVTLQGSGPLE